MQSSFSKRVTYPINCLTDGLQNYTGKTFENRNKESQRRIMFAENRWNRLRARVYNLFNCTQTQLLDKSAYCIGVCVCSFNITIRCAHWDTFSILPHRGEAGFTFLSKINKLWSDKTASLKGENKAFLILLNPIEWRRANEYGHQILLTSFLHLLLLCVI